MIIKHQHYDPSEYIVKDFNGTEHTVDYLSKKSCNKLFVN